MKHSSFLRRVSVCAVISLGIGAVQAAPVSPQSIPGPADASRVKPDDNLLAPLPDNQGPLVFPDAAPENPIPEGAKSIQFVLNGVVIKGATVFSPAKLETLYDPYLHQKVSLEVAYKLAAKITQLYREEGYFLSIANVPEQKIKDGIITITVTEGYIGDVDSSAMEQRYYVVDEYIDRMRSEKPLKAQTLESFLLQMNDMPGVSFRAVLSPINDASDPGAVKLTLIPSDKKGAGFVSFDNFSSRFLGPHEGTLSYSASIIPFQQTTISLVNSVPLSALHYGSITQRVPVYPDIDVEFGGSTTQVQPGYTLEPLEIKSRSNTFDVGVDYQLLRSRQQNLSASVKFDVRNTNTDALSVPITEDKIRALRAGFDFDSNDHWQGYNTARVVLSQGINGLGSSKEGALDLSRASAKPDFTKIEFSASRLQQVTDEWAVEARANAQLSSDPLYSAEEFGYGGQQYGRAFDASELIGDEGVSAALEVRYGGLLNEDPIALQPFGFYDFGLVTNQDPSQPPRETGASIGAGIRFSTPWNQSGNITAAVPLIRTEATPIYGLSDHGPRISFQFMQNF